jgi:hypothetical protein
MDLGSQRDLFRAFGGHRLVLTYTLPGLSKRIAPQFTVDILNQLPRNNADGPTGIVLPDFEKVQTTDGQLLSTSIFESSQRITRPLNIAQFKLRLKKKLISSYRLPLSLNDISACNNRCGREGLS